MSNTYQAIFEHGVLRPLQPLPLKEDDVVSISIIGSSEGTQPNADEELARKQRETIMAFIEEMEAEPDENPEDGLTNRDHDRIIYGF
jgi:predicted DNA-binding antitoxin AbrB/MazE fold protein